MPNRHSSASTLARRPRNPEKAARKVQSLRAQLTDHLIGEDLEEAVGVLRSSLKATKHQPMGKFSSIEVPDHSTRVAAAKLILEYAVGKPATTAEVTLNPSEGELRETDTGTIVQRIRNSGLDLSNIIEVYDADDDDPSEIANREAMFIAQEEAKDEEHQKKEQQRAERSFQCRY